MKTLEDLLQDKFGVKTSYHEQPKVSQIEVDVTKAMSYNPNRLGLVFVNTGANNVYLAPSNSVSVGRGILVSPNGGVVTMNMNDDFELVGMEWFGIADGAASECYVLEVVSVP